MVEGEPTLFEIWVCADGYWADHTKLLCIGELRADYRVLEEGLMAVYRSAIDHCEPGASMGELDVLVRDGLEELGYPGQPTHPICHGIGARAHEPPYPHRAAGGTIEAGMVLAIEPGCYWEGGGGLRVEDNFLITETGAEQLSPFPDGVVLCHELIWTGALNDAYEIGGRVGLYDTTLRDGEQTVGVVLDPDQKLEIARLLDELGVDRIEAGFPRVSDDDWQAVERIAAAGLRAEIWGFSRAVPADLEALVELGVSFSVIESPISDLKLDAIGVSREKMLGRITAAMRFAAEHGIHAAFFGVDSTRAERDFYDQVYSAAVEAGAKEVVVVDTLGIASPEAVAELVGHTVELVDVPVHFHGHNDFGVATASRGRSGARGRDLRARDDQRDGRARGQREPRRGRPDAEGALRRRVEPAAGSHPRRVGARARAVRLRARAVEAGDRRDALPARVRCGRLAVPRPAVDRAVLVGARRDASARSSSARRAGSTRSASRRRSSGSTFRRSGAPRCSRR